MSCRSLSSLYQAEQIIKTIEIESSLFLLRLWFSVLCCSFPFFCNLFFHVIRINLLVKHQKLNWANEYVIKCLCIQHSVSTYSAKSFKLVAIKTKQKTSNHLCVCACAWFAVGFFFRLFFHSVEMNDIGSIRLLSCRRMILLLLFTMHTVFRKSELMHLISSDLCGGSHVTMEPCKLISFFFALLFCCFYIFLPSFSRALAYSPNTTQRK